MLRIKQTIATDIEPKTTLTLPFEKRQKSRLQATLDNGEQAGLFLPRGTLLRGGDCLLAEDGCIILVIAADELTSTAYSKNNHQLMRACYHLGNRHVPLQISNDFVRYQYDYVLDEMVASFGLEIKKELAPFEPESGAYNSHGKYHHNHHVL